MKHLILATLVLLLSACANERHGHGSDDGCDLPIAESVKPEEAARMIRDCQLAHPDRPAHQKRGC